MVERDLLLIYYINTKLVTHSLNNMQALIIKFDIPHKSTNCPLYTKNLFKAIVNSYEARHTTSKVVGVMR